MMTVLSKFVVRTKVPIPLVLLLDNSIRLPVLNVSALETENRPQFTALPAWPPKTCAIPFPDLYVRLRWIVTLFPANTNALLIVL